MIKTKKALMLVSLILTALVNAASAIEIEKVSPMIDHLFQDYNLTNGPGASVMIIRDGKVLLKKSYGLADVENKVPIRPDSNFRLASVTKQFTAMAIMILAEKNRLDFDDPITKFFPEFPEYGKAIKVRNLLNHTSGLMDYEDLIPEGTTIPVLDIDALRLLEQTNQTYFPPGTAFRYCNTGYAFLALIIQKVSGQTYAAFLQDHIFKPLHMDTTLAYEQGISQVPNRAFGYTLKNGKAEKTDQSLTSSVLGDGGIYSSINDLYKWDQSLYTTKLVSHKMLEQAFAPGPSTRLVSKTNISEAFPANSNKRHEAHYGFGWFVSDYHGQRNIWHSGSTRGFSNRIERFPESKFTIIILTNRNDAPLVELPQKIADLFLANEK